MRVRLKYERLAELVRTSRLSQNHWAMRLGLSRGHFSDLVRGKYPYPSRRTQTRLTEIFGVPFDDLFLAEEEREDWSEGSRAAFQAAIADRYLVDEELGRGGMGTVYLARDVKHGRRVAIKVMSPEAVSGIGAARFLREIRKTASLDHHHIVTLIDSGEAAGYPYYVMPYVRGGSLRARLKAKGRFTPQETAQCVRGIAAGLQYAHHQNLIHCDIKPENILFSDEHPYVADFGIARTVHAEARTWGRANELDSSAGTPAYVSPEQALGETDLDGRADIYSLACVVYEMLTGSSPFEGTTTLQIVSKRFAKDPPNVRDIAPHVPHAIAAVVQKAMAVDVGRRYSSIDKFAAALEDAVRSADTARYRVRAAFASIEERVRRAVGADRRSRARWLDVLSQHVRFMFRNLRRSPGFAIAAALTLGLGIGSNITMFEILDRLFLRPPAHVAEPESVHRVYVSQRFSGRPSMAASLSWADIQDLGANGHFERAAGFFSSSLTMGRGREARRLSVTMVSPSFFPLLGVRPLIGRFPRPEENTPFGEPSVAVLSHGAWQRVFGGERDILGRSIPLGQGTYTIIGVTPPGFSGVDLRPVDVFVPIRSAANENIGGPWETSRGIKWVRAIVRLQDGATIQAAETEASERYRTGTRDRPSFDPEARVIAAPLIAATGPLADANSKVAKWLGGVSLIVLLIACANVANLLLARAVRRSREVAIRLALGVSRMRLVGHFLTESLMLAVLGGAAALLAGRWAGDVMRSTLLPNLEWTRSLFDWRILLVTLVIVTAAALGAGLVPALLASRTDLGLALKGGAPGTRGRWSLRSVLLASQAALSVVLLVGAGLFIESLRSARGRDIGFELGRLLVATVEQDAIFDAERASEVYHASHERLAGFPGVEGVALSNSIPFRSNWAESLVIPGVDSMPTVETGGPYINTVSHGYFETMGMRIVRGRGFGSEDIHGSAPVGVVSETMARLVWPGDDPIGRCMKIGGAAAPCVTVIGVVNDVTQQNLVDQLTMVYYVLLEQQIVDASPAALFVRAAQPSTLFALVQRSLLEADADIPYVSVRTLESLADPQLRSWRLGATMFSIFGGLALLVAAVGLFSVTAFDVVQRRRELGVRAALGATGQRLIGGVLLHGIRLVLIGVVVGLAAAALAARGARALLFDVAPVHLPTYTLVAAVLILAAVVASSVPAWRTTRIEPTEALRAE